MLKRASIFGLFLACVLAAFVVMERSSSPFFQRCIRENENYNDQAAAKENLAANEVVIVAYIRCSGRFIDRHEASIAALATIIIAAFTFTLWQSTEKLWKAGEKQLRHAETEAHRARFYRLKDEPRIQEQIKIAQQSADAALLNAKAVIDAQRARLFVVVPEENIASTIQRACVSFLNTEDEVNFSVFLRYAFKNYGKTPAILREMKHGIIVAENVLRYEPIETVIDLPNRIIAEGVTSESVRVFARIARQEIESISNLQTVLWFWGKVIYDDTFDWTRTLNFVWRYDARTSRFSWFSHKETEDRTST